MISYFKSKIFVVCTEIYEVDFKSGKQFSLMLNISVLH